MTVKDKVAIVTGASRGIGRAIAEHLAKEGAKVVCCATKQETCDSVAQELSQKYGVTCIGQALDVSNFESVQETIKAIHEKMGQIDILVNNAGITRDNLLLRMGEEDWQAVLDVNLNSVFNTTKAVMRPMLKQRSGKIINITSVVGVMGNPGQANYAASKAGVIGFTKSIAKEIGAKGITCNAIAPGFIETDMIQSLPVDYLNGIIESIPMKRLGKPEDISALVTFLGSDAASYITGKVFEVDGGIHM